MLPEEASGIIQPNDEWSEVLHAQPSNYYCQRAPRPKHSWIGRIMFQYFDNPETAVMLVNCIIMTGLGRDVHVLVLQ